MTGRVMRYTVIVTDPVTGASRPVLAGKPVPEWAKDLVHTDDLVEVETSYPEDEAATAPIGAPALLELPEGTLDELLDWVSEGDDYPARAARGNAVYVKAVDGGTSAEDLQDLGKEIATAVYGPADTSDEVTDEAPDDEAGQNQDPEPPRAGPGSGVEAWSAYAKGLGIEVSADAKRDDVIELVDNHRASAQA